MKGVAAGLILFSTGAMGLTIARSFSHQVHSLRQLMTFVQVLESEIRFARTTLPHVLAHQATQFSGAIGMFLSIVSTGLKAGHGEPFIVVWEAGLDSLASNGVPGSTLEDLRGLGDVLGTSDVTEQIKHLNVLLHRLEQTLKRSEEERDKQTRLWQYLGFSSGLLLCLLLL
ncbi:MAG: stage III sporulation protein AB [Limnochordia bacterium]|jgi:stage III sporulation protein AB|nr:stage III sporulation protein AB [Limnochordia bacterium]